VGKLGEFRTFALLFLPTILLRILLKRLVIGRLFKQQWARIVTNIRGEDAAALWEGFSRAADA
jgi:hypothetical protein